MSERIRDQKAPGEIREGVRSGILSSLERDTELRGGRTARLLVAAGVAGAAGAVGITLLVVTHPFDHHPPWHVVMFSTVWAGLLVVAFAVAFLRIRTPSLPLAQSASIALLGLGLAGVCGAVCPDPHFLHWWSATSVGRPITEGQGLAISALCFGLVTTIFIAFAASLMLWRKQAGSGGHAIVPTTMLLALLLPGVVLQSIGTSVAVFVGWFVGVAAGAYAGIWGGVKLRERIGERGAV